MNSKLFRKFTAFVLVLIMGFSSAVAYGAPGDIIHVGLKKIYRLSDSNYAKDHSRALLDDIRKNASDADFYKGFYREVESKGEGKKFVNIQEEEQAEADALAEFLRSNNITDPKEYQNFLSNTTNLQRANDAIKSAKENVASVDFEHIKEEDESLSDYKSPDETPLLRVDVNYSPPTPGSKEGTVKIDSLAFPTGASRWMYMVVEKKVDSVKLNTTVQGTVNYSRGRDIEVKANNYILLLAADNMGRAKAYACIEIKDEFISKPANEIENVSIAKSSVFAGAVVVNSIPPIEGAGEWSYKIFNTSAPSYISVNSKIEDAVDYKINDEIPIFNENELFSSTGANTKKKLLLLATDLEGKIKAYKVFDVGISDTAKAPTRLQETTNYSGPEAGSADGTTRFTSLHKGISPDNNMKHATKWIVVRNGSKFFFDGKGFGVPAIDSEAPIDNEYTSEYTTGEDIPLEVSQSLLLLAVDDDNKIKGYRIFNNLSSDEIRGETAKPLEDKNYSDPQKGSKAETTKISTLSLSGISGNPVGWRYKVGYDLLPPMLNKTLSGSKPYVPGDDIQGKAGQKLLIVAVDKDDRVQAYQRFDITEGTNGNLRGPNAILLVEGINYSAPVKGDTIDTTKFNTLIFNDKTEWMYKVQKDELDIPELDSKADGAHSFKRGTLGNLKDAITDATKSPLSPGDNLLLLATEGADNKIKGYKILKLTELQIRAQNVAILPESNYGTPEPGSVAGTTRISDLKLTGIGGATHWRYKVVQDDSEIKNLDVTTTVVGSSSYFSGGNISVTEGQFIALLATDSSGRVKAYSVIEIKKEQIKPPAAQLLALTTNYSMPVAGTGENSTRFEFLDFSSISGATKWMYKASDTSFGVVDYDSVVVNAIPYDYPNNKNIINIKVGQRLLLLATDEDEKVKAYREFTLTQAQVRGKNALELNKTTIKNFDIEKGSKAGTTRFVNLAFWGLDGNPSRWQVKVLSSSDNFTPAFDSIVAGASFYTEGNDISVLTGDKVLLLATDSSGRVKGYKVIDTTKDVVREHAPKLAVTMGPGTKVDTVKLTEKVSKDSDEKSPTDGSKLLILVDNQEHPIPAVDEVLSKGKEYTLGKDISVLAGQYVTVFEVDDDNKVKAFMRLLVEEKHIKKANAAIRPHNSTELKDIMIPEGAIATGGEKIIVELSNGGMWAEDIRANKAKRDALFDGLKTETESEQWAKVVSALKNDGQGSIYRDSDTKLTIFLPEVKGYDISSEQIITLTIPPSAIEGGLSPIIADKSIKIAPTVSAVLSGSVLTGTLKNADIVAGGKTIIIELVDGNWVHDIATKNNRDKLFDGLTLLGSNNMDLSQWKKVVESLNSLENSLVRNNSRKITITLPAASNYKLENGLETIRLTIPKDLVEDATTDIVATPTFTIRPDTLKVAGRAIENTVTMVAPDQRSVRGGTHKLKDDTWLVEVTVGTLKDKIAASDLIISGLPTGLTTKVDKVDVNRLLITVAGTATTPVTVDKEVRIKIKKSAVTDFDAIDSDEIVLLIKAGGSIVEDLKNVKYEFHNLEANSDDLRLKLNNTSRKMEYSLDSTNGINGIWSDCKDTNSNEKGIGYTTDIILPPLDTLSSKPITIYVREKDQPTVYVEVVTLSRDPAPNVIANVTGGQDKIRLVGATTNMEYSLDGGISWSDITEPIASGKEVINGFGKDLRVRTKVTSTSLPSLPTPKLNGIDLSKVHINVASGVMLNTSKEMQYSFNSNGGFGGDWYDCQDKESKLSFLQGNLYIREKAMVTNFKHLGNIVLEDTPTKTVHYNIALGKLVGIDDKMEYRLGGGSWVRGSVGAEIYGVNFVPGKLEYRAAATKDKLPSPIVVFSNSDYENNGTIASPASPPELLVDIIKKTIKSPNGTNLDSTYEYKIGNGPWISGERIKDEVFSGNITIYVRKKATKYTLPSQQRVINFTNNLDFSNVKVNVSEGVITGTTTAMEYSLTSTDGLNGTWVNCSNNITAVNFSQHMTVFVREKSKPLNYTSVLGYVNDGSTPKRIERESVPQLDINIINYNILEQSITISDPLDYKTLEYRIGSNGWKGLVDNTTYNVSFVPGKLEFRTKGSLDKLPSLPVAFPVKQLSIVHESASAPNLIYDDVEHSIEKIGTSEGLIYEYKVNNSPWVPGEVNTQFTGNDRVIIRVKATEYSLPSQEQIVNFTPNLDLLYGVTLDVGQGLLKNTTSTMEYSLNSTDGFDGNWSQCINGNTKVSLILGSKVYIRNRAKHRNVIPVTNEAIVPRKFSDEGINLTEETVKNSVDFDIAKGTLVIGTSIVEKNLVSELQYRIGGSSYNWINFSNISKEANGTIIESKVTFYPGPVEVRLKGNAEKLPSSPITVGIIKSRKSGPVVEINNVENIVISIKGTSSTIDPSYGSNSWSIFEYSINNGPWVSGEYLSDEDLSGNKTVRIREAATKDSLASQETEKNFTKNLELSHVGLSTHTTPFELNGTAKDMQYNIYLNDNKTGWKDCSDGNTQLPHWLSSLSNVDRIEIRDKNQPENVHVIYSYSTTNN